MGKVKTDEIADKLKLQFLQYQRQHRKQPYPIIVVLEGLDSEKLSQLGNKLYEWLDGRFVERQTYPHRAPKDTQFPTRFQDWLGLPKYGQIGIYFGSWYSGPIQRFLDRQISDAEFRAELKSIKAFEKLLHKDGAKIIKLWLEPDAKSLAEDKNGSELSDIEWLKVKRKKRVRNIRKLLDTETSDPKAPWLSIETTAETFTLDAGQKLWDALQYRPEVSTKRKSSQKKALAQPKTNLLKKLDLTKTLAKNKYKKELAKWQLELRRLTQEVQRRDLSLVFVFEGSDAAGKGGAIRRLMAGMDARIFRVYPISAPSHDELRYHYLHRFWRRVPKRARVAIFDRSWYGRVLVERVEGFATQEEWSRAYDEINEFEQQLLQSGRLVIKTWLQIDEEEQMERFKARQNDPTKLHKITEEDWRNREKWPEYQEALEAMLARTSPESCPWNVIPANCKKYARIAVFKSVCSQIHDWLF